MSYLIIEAKKVRAGDALYMGEDFAKNPNHRFVSITKVSQMKKPNDQQTLIFAGKTGYIYQSDEAVQIQRFDDLEENQENPVPTP